MSKQRLRQRQRRHHRIVCKCQAVKFNISIKTMSAHEVYCPVESRSNFNFRKARLNRKRIKSGGEQIPFNMERRKVAYSHRTKTGVLVTRMVSVLVPVFGDVKFNEKGRI